MQRLTPIPLRWRENLLLGVLGQPRPILPLVRLREASLKSAVGKQTCFDLLPLSIDLRQPQAFLQAMQLCFAIRQTEFLSGAKEAPLQPILIARPQWQQDDWRQSLVLAFHHRLAETLYLSPLFLVLVNQRLQRTQLGRQSQMPPCIRRLAVGLLWAIAILLVLHLLTGHRHWLGFPPTYLVR